MTAGGGVEVVADSGVIELLDFHPVFPCEHSQHTVAHPGDEPAVVFMSVRCPGCGDASSFMMCGPGLAHYVSVPVGCRVVRGGCGFAGQGSDFVVRVTPIGDVK